MILQGVSLTQNPLPKSNPVFSPSCILELGRDADSPSGVSWIHPSDLSHRTKLHLKKVHGLWSQRDKSSKPNSDFCPSSVAMGKIILLLWASVSLSIKWEGNTSNHVGFWHFSHPSLCFLLTLFPCLWCFLFHWHKIFRLFSSSASSMKSPLIFPALDAFSVLHVLIASKNFTYLTIHWHQFIYDLVILGIFLSPSLL